MSRLDIAVIVLAVVGCFTASVTGGLLLRSRSRSTQGLTRSMVRIPIAGEPEALAGGVEAKLSPETAGRRQTSVVMIRLTGDDRGAPVEHEPDRGARKVPARPVFHLLPGERAGRA
jgi:hypothetical protein